MHFRKIYQVSFDLDSTFWTPANLQNSWREHWPTYGKRLAVSTFWVLNFPPKQPSNHVYCHWGRPVLEALMIRCCFNMVSHRRWFKYFHNENT